MNTSVLARILDVLPLMVSGLEINDPVLTLFGNGWGLSIVCPWALDGLDVHVTWESDPLDEVWVLAGRALVGVTANDESATDPTFHFEGGLSLEVNADTVLDPWTLILPGLVVTGTYRP